MVDVLTRKQRSRNMAAIKGKNTKPEMMIRRTLHRAGYRYSLHCRDLPGRPDLVFRSRRKAIFVHGCFWHMHDCRFGSVIPATNATFWHQKRQQNVTRDSKQRAALEAQGWRVLVVWECEVRSEGLTDKLVRFLEKRHGPNIDNKRKVAPPKRTRVRISPRTSSQ